MLKYMIEQNALNTWIIGKLIADVSDEQLYTQPPALPNHIAWQLGHLIYARAGLCEMLGQPGPVKSADFAAYAPGTSANLENRQPMSYWRNNFEASQAHLAKVLPTVTDALLDQPTPNESVRKRLPKLGNLTMLLAVAHDGWHIGQMCDLRRAMGLPRVL